MSLLSPLLGLLEMKAFLFSDICIHMHHMDGQHVVHPSTSEGATAAPGRTVSAGNGCFCEV